MNMLVPILPSLERNKEKPLYEETYKLLIIPYMKLMIYSDRMEIKFLFFTYRTSFKDIVSIDTMSSVPWYVGYGLRMHFWNRTLYFLPHRKNLLVLEKKSGFWRRMILGVNNREKIMKIIKEKVKSR